ncbi:undecaprenyl-diphosphate phosphatase [uncultured Parolsenella sp.]|uniref:undecaprenyl-diphosphate phosphatase n=1 Tax=uncultured Parolsenella sp. TaxID=2083008 RepID=UPI0027DC7A2F|nr:undecaprenyl-diphosphate phosphatase [uncultured Parolsenella sp.]
MNIIDLIKSAFLGLVEGITEWLPISSTGHMILVDEFVKMDVSAEFWNMFLVVIQLGAILSVCVLYFHQLNPFSPSKGREGRRATWNLWGKIVLGCIPAAAIGIPLSDFMDEHFYNSYVVAGALIVYGIAFIAIENWRARKRSELAVERPRGAHFAPTAAGRAEQDADFGAISSIEDISYKTAFGIGCFQVLSLVPGTSRSGSTIIGGLLLGCTRAVAAEFTFYLAIPVMFGASLLKVVKFLLKGAAMGVNEWGIMAVGLVVAFVVSLAAIRWLTGFVRRHDFKVFGWYRIVLGIVVLAYFLVVAPALGLA